jgi:ABC-type microcin C transport system permease subunit YejB
VQTNDFPVVLATVMIGGVMVILSNLLADILYSLVSPSCGAVAMERIDKRHRQGAPDSRGRST